MLLDQSDPLGSHPWYQAQPLDKQIAIGMWRQANMAKVGTQFEGILVRGLLHYAFWVPNGSPEYRYCVHESIEECSHSLMFQEIVNRIGVDVPGMPRWLRVLSPVVPFYAGSAAERLFLRGPGRRGAVRLPADEPAARTRAPVDAPDHGRT